MIVSRGAFCEYLHSVTGGVSDMAAG